MASAEEKRRCRTVPDRFPSANNQHMVLGRKGMTTPVRIQQSIRQLETKGLTHTQIARELGVSRTTVVKYATRDYSPVPPTGGTASRSLVAGEYARKAAGHRRAGLPADRHRRGQAPVPGRRGFLREAERGVHHEPGVRTVGRGVRRRRHGRRGHRPHRAPRKDRQVPWRVIPQQPLPDEINEKSGTNPAAGDGVHFERRWCSD